VQYIVLDTDIASQSLRRKLTHGMKARLSGAAWCVTFVTVAELWLWAEIRSWGQRSRAELDGWLSSVVVIDSDDEVSRTWGRTAAAARRRGRPRPTNDSWIAACCLARGLPLATQNVKDYVDFVEHDGLTLVIE
jgi:predicted nucleic acid-binding protein